jgi:hypothetical protein
VTDVEIGESGLDLQSYLEEAPTAWELVGGYRVCMCVFVWISMTQSDAYVCGCVWLCVHFI